MTDPIDINDPQEGFYKRRLVRNGVWVPARIWWEYGEIDQESGHKMEDDVLCCIVNGRRRDPYKEWTWLAKHRITEADYNFMVDDALDAKAHRPDDPKANPRKPADIGKMRSIF